MRVGSMPRRKVIFSFLGIALLGAFFYVGLWPFIVGSCRMESFCSSLSNGLSVTEVASLAAQKGYRLGRLLKEQRALVHEPRSMGRFLCVLEFREERLVSAKLSLTTKPNRVAGGLLAKPPHHSSRRVRTGRPF